MLTKWADVIASRPRRVLLGAVLAVVAAAVYGLGVFGGLSSGGFDDPGSDSYQVAQTVNHEFGDQQVDLTAIYTSTGGQPATSPQVRRQVEAVVSALPADKVRAVRTYYSTQARSLLSTDGRSTMIAVTLAGDSQGDKVDLGKQVAPLLKTPALETRVGGIYAVFTDVNGQVGADIGRAEGISMPIVFLLSLIIFGSVASALMPTMVGAVAVLGAFALVRLIGQVTEVSIFAINVITLLGMGLAIDYALFIVTRFREELSRQPLGTDRRAAGRAALRTTMATAGRTVLFSGVIVAASLASLLVFPQTFLRSMGYGGMAAVLVAMVAALTLLPAVLVLLGHRLEWGRMPRRLRAGDEAIESRFWGRLAGTVMRRPVLVLTGVVALLALLTSPLLGASFGGVNEKVLPADAPSRVAADFQAAHFGGERSTAPVIVSGGERAAVQRYTEQLAAVGGPGRVTVRVAAVRPVGGVPTTMLEASWVGSSQSSSSQQIAKDLRAVPAPTGATAAVGGSSAATVDLLESIGSQLPWMALIVAVVMFVLMFIAFGSLVLPLKAIVMTTISIGASFGVVTWIFSEGHLSGLLGFTPLGYLDASQPILMLAILFGLSMDYEVFLLSRIREQWDRTGDNTTSVRTGVERTGRIITSAALLLAIVIGGFSTSGIVFIKMIGVGMLVAVLLDATVVRGLLVPGTMRLLGRWNWWAPAPLARWWRTHGHREGAGSANVPKDQAVPEAGAMQEDRAISGQIARV